MEKRELTKQEHENIALHIKAALIQIDRIEEIAKRELGEVPECIDACFSLFSLGSRMKLVYLSAVGSPYDCLDSFRAVASSVAERQCERNQ